MCRFLVLFFFLPLLLRAQKVQTLAPSQPVVKGNAFQVQYLVTDPESFTGLTLSLPDSVRIVSGPNEYTGQASINGRVQAIRNVTYTFVAAQTGQLLIAGPVLHFRQMPDLRGEDARIVVQDPPKASFRSSSSYTDVKLYAPSANQNLNPLISNNLFVVARANKTSAYPGEAVVLSFTLYSRLQSTSEVLNAPSLYGLSVVDMVNTNESHLSVDTIDKKIFNASLLRKLQVYPERPGTVTIDPMQIRNTIEFDNQDPSIVEKVIMSSPLSIRVKPFPSAPPDSFHGAVGNFSIRTRVSPASLRQGQQGTFELTVRGTGNFNQMAAPQIDWPSSFDAFDPAVVEDLDKSQAPLKGTKTFRYVFTADSAGSFEIPSVVLSYFDPSDRKFHTVRSDSLSLQVQPSTATAAIAAEGRKDAKPANYWWLLALPILLLLYFILRKKKTLPAPVLPEVPDCKAELTAINLENLSAPEACRVILRLLSRCAEGKQLNEEQQNLLRSIRSDCEIHLYAPVESPGWKADLRERAARFIDLTGG